MAFTKIHDNGMEENLLEHLSNYCLKLCFRKDVSKRTLKQIESMITHRESQSEAGTGGGRRRRGKEVESYLRHEYLE